MSDKVLIVDDEPSNRKILTDELTDCGYVVATANSGADALKAVQTSRPDLIMLDYMMPGLTGLDVLRELRRCDDDTPVVMITAYSTVDRAVEAMKEGAYDFIARPFEPDHVRLVAQKAIERARLKRAVDIHIEDAKERYRLIVGASDKTQKAVEMAKKAAASNATVLLCGESGTGKEIFARAIHNWSDRRTLPFVAINSVGLSKELLESELFGYEPGAFTGALKRKKGKIELAQGGTLFFDEIGEIAPEIQAKLLRFLQEREFERVGGLAPINADVRIIAATNRDLSQAVIEGRFREDLYYRLNVIAITLPPLRERKEDIPALARHFLGKYAAATGRTVSAFSAEAEAWLFSYRWPGNVRELANVVERAVVLGSGVNIEIDDLPTLVTSGSSSSAATLSYRPAINALRKEMIMSALVKTSGNRSAAARLLGLEGRYFLRLMKSLGID